MSDRDAFRANRDAALKARHETREARAVRKAVAEEIAEALEAYLGYYPEDIFPPDGTSRDCIGAVAMRHAYPNAARIAREIGSRGSRMIIPTDGGLHPSDAKWEPMREWLTANLFDIDWVPTDAWICVRDECCLGVEVYVRDNAGRLIADPETGRPPRRVEWHPMVQPPPPILLSAGEVA